MQLTTALRNFHYVLPFKYLTKARRKTYFMTS